MQNLPLPDHVYEGLLAFTATQGTTPADWIAAQVLPTPQSLPKPNTVEGGMSDIIGSVDSRKLSRTPPQPTVFEQALIDKMEKQGVRIP